MMFVAAVIEAPIRSILAGTCKASSADCSNAESPITVKPSFNSIDLSCLQ